MNQNEKAQQIKDMITQMNAQTLMEKSAVGTDENIGKWELDMEPYLDRIYNELLGNSIDGEGNWKRDNNKERFMNELGASDFISELSSRLSIHMQFSDLTDRDIIEIASETAENFGDKIEDNYQSWEIKPTFSNYEALGMKMYHALYILLKIAQSGGMKHHREKSRNPYVNVQQEQQNEVM